LVRLLGSDGDLRFEQLPDGLHVSLPDQSPGKHAYVLRIEFAGSH
jgi:hypothetical protein